MIEQRKNHKFDGSSQVFIVTEAQKAALVGVKMKMQPSTSYTVQGRGSSRRAFSGDELAFSASELLLSLGVFVALIGLSIWVLVHYCVFAK